MNDFLPIEHAWAWALGVCAVAAALEGVLAGTGVKRFLTELKQPQHSLPLWAWAIVGLLYYVLFFAVVHGLLSVPPTPLWTPIALGLALVLLGANAAWNWIFFCRKDLLLSLLFFGPYAFLAVVLAIVLFRLDNPIAGWYLLYLVYGVYATWWGYKIWRLNTPPATPPTPNGL